MPKQKIVFYELKETETPYFKEYLKPYIDKVDVEFISKPLTSKTVDKTANIVCCFVNSELTGETLSLAKNLKYIVTRSTGFDHIDIDYCKKNNILVSNVPNYGQNTVAEHAMALLLALTKKILPSVESVQSGNFSPVGFTGVDLKNKIVGVIGMGHIGSNFVKMATGFGMHVIAYDLFVNKSLENEYGFTYVELDYLLSKSDFISIHVPLCDDTKHLINKKNITKLKKGVYIINTSRGPIIETEALVSGLDSGTIAGVGLDVLESEKDMDFNMTNYKTLSEFDLKNVYLNQILLKSTNVIVTPHNAFNTVEAQKRINDTSLLNISEYIKGGKVNLVLCEK